MSLPDGAGSGRTPDRACNARPVSDGWLDEPYAAAFLRLKLFGFTDTLAFTLASNGYGPTSVAALEAEREAERQTA